MTGAPLPPPVWPPPAAPESRPDRAALAQPVRQAPIALVFIAWRFVRRLGWSALIAGFIFISNGGLAAGGLTLAVLVAVTLLVSSTLSWWRFTFRVVDDELVVTKGVLSVERLVIPLDRVQSVDIDQRLTHRLFGVVNARVDTAGSADVEFEIDAVERDTAEALRRVATDVRDRSIATAPAGSSGSPAEPQAPDELLVRRRPRELVVVGLTRAPLAGLVVLAPLIAYGDELGFLGRIESRLQRTIEETDGGGIGWNVSTLLWAIAVVLIVTVGGALLQVTQEVVRNWELSLFRTPSGLRRTAGLFTTTSRSSTVRRVQAISTDDSPIQRWMGITHLRLRTFGANDISLPGTRPAEVELLRGIVFGTPAPPALDRRISRAFVFLAVRNAVLLTIPFVALAWFAIGGWSLLILTLVPVRWATAERRWQLRRWSLVDGRLAEVRQLLARHAAELQLHKVQLVDVGQSFFERRRGLATLTVRSADGSITVPLIPLDEANACRDVILHAVEADRRPFL